jgi:hypothetical protein
MKADRILFRDGVLQREAKILFTEPGGPESAVVVIYESDDPRKQRVGKIREDRGHYLLTIDGVLLRSEGNFKGAQTQCRAFKKLQDAKDFATEVFSSAGKDWMVEQ